jgi:hypothetical protein
VNDIPTRTPEVKNSAGLSRTELNDKPSVNSADGDWLLSLG